MRARATAAPPAYTEGTEVQLSLDLAGNLRVLFPASVAVTGPLTDAQLRASRVPVVLPPSDLGVTATAAVNTAVTATLPAGGAATFQYITSIQIVKLYSVLGVAAGAGVIITTTNLPPLTFTTEQLAAPAGSAPRVVDLFLAASPIKASAANTAVTIVCPAQLQTIWRVNVRYFVAA